jgi:hypothetical protein
MMALHLLYLRLHSVGDSRSLPVECPHFKLGMSLLLVVPSDTSWPALLGMHGSHSSGVAPDEPTSSGVAPGEAWQEGHRSSSLLGVQGRAELHPDPKLHAEILSYTAEAFDASLLSETSSLPPHALPQTLISSYPGKE